jgi:hypothetical protein
MLNYVELIDRALSDPQVLSRANELAAQQSAESYLRQHDHGGHLRISYAGECVRKTWARVHDAEDIPESPRGLRKMRDGSRSGVETACLIVAGIERWHPEYGARCEVDVTYDNIPGHADVIVYTAGPKAVEVVECKRTGGYWAPTKANPQGPTPETKAPWYITQACAYAAGVEAETFVILVDTPADHNTDLRQFRYYTDEWRFDAAADYARLSAALDDEPPEGDAQEGFRCVSCRFSNCPRNQNPLRPEPDVAAQLERSLSPAAQRDLDDIRRDASHAVMFGENA